MFINIVARVQVLVMAFVDGFKEGYARAQYRKAFDKASAARLQEPIHLRAQALTDTPMYYRDVLGCLGDLNADGSYHN